MARKTTRKPIEQVIAAQMTAKGYNYQLTPVPKSAFSPLYVKTLNQIGGVFRMYPEIKFTVKEI